MYITITGGGFLNKGAEAMTYAAVHEIETHYPNDRIVVFCKKVNYDVDEKRFLIVEDDFFSRVYLCCPLSRLWIKKKIDLKRTQRLETVFKNTKYNVDVSGYALGSNWGIINSLVYLIKIYTGKKYHFPVYVLPQSFGPFKYKGIKGIFVYCAIKKILQYPRIIYARENVGYALLKRMGLKNIQLATDIVLTSRENEKKVHIDVQQPAVLIVPNERNLDYIQENKMLQLYKEICSCLKEKGYYIYLMAHSVKDRDLCKTMVKEIKTIKYIDHEWDSSEMTPFIRNFQFIIASRYHAVIHAYKGNIPCIVIGWAEKYRELMRCFGQEKYYVDVKIYDDDYITSKVLPVLEEQHKLEIEKIKETREIFCQRSVFQDIRDDYRQYMKEDL